jgi:hypothetical protein
MRLCALLLTTVLAGGPALIAAQDDDDLDFDRLVAAVERHYGKRRLHIPFMGVASFLSGAARPLGASGVKLAVIQDVDRAGAFQPRLPHGWRPLVRISRDGQEETAIYGHDEGKSVKMFMIAQEGDDAVVMQFKMHPSRILEFIARKARE